jgi:PAS domain-containing protein
MTWSNADIGGHRAIRRGLRRARAIAAPALESRTRRGDVVPLAARARHHTTTVDFDVDDRPEPMDSIERRRPRPTTTAEYLDQLPARILLDRLPTPALAVGLDGAIIYANLACAKLLGHADTTTLTEQPLNTLLAGQSHTAPRDCLNLLRTNDTGVVTIWYHADGYPVATLLSPPLLIRDDDTLLLITVTDMTEWLWSNQPSMACSQGVKRPSVNVW